MTASYDENESVAEVEAEVATIDTGSGAAFFNAGVAFAGSAMVAFSLYWIGEVKWYSFISDNACGRYTLNIIT